MKYLVRYGASGLGFYAVWKLFGLEQTLLRIFSRQENLAIFWGNAITFLALGLALAAVVNVFDWKSIA